MLGSIYAIVKMLIIVVSIYFVLIAVALFMAIRQRYFGSDEKEIHETNKILRGLKIAISVFALVLFGATIYFSTAFERDDPKMYVCIFVGLVLFLIGILSAVKLDQFTGVAVCTQCCKKREPSYSEILLSPHLFESKYLRCPECRRRTWHRKEI